MRGAGCGWVAFALLMGHATLAGATPTAPAAPPPLAARPAAAKAPRSPAETAKMQSEIAKPAARPAVKAPRSPAEIAAMEAEANRLAARGDDYHADAIRALLEDERSGPQVAAPKPAPRPAVRTPRSPAEIASMEQELARLEARGDHYHADALRGVLDDERSGPQVAAPKPAPRPAVKTPRSPAEIASMEQELARLEARGDHYHADALRGVLDDERSRPQVAAPRPAVRTPRSPAEIAKMREEISKLEARGDHYHADGLQALLDDELRASPAAPPPLASGSAIRNLGIARPSVAGAKPASAAQPKGQPGTTR